MPPVTKARTPTPLRRYAAPALEKGLDILELFAREPEGLIKSEVARRLSRTTSEVFRMLVCLQERGYISQGPEERYHLTLKLFELAHIHPPTKRLLHEALPLMHDVADSTGQSCHLGIIDNGTVIILAQVDAPSSTGFFVKPGSQVDLMLAASGYVILAFMSYHAQSRTVEQYRNRGGQMIPADLAPHLERIRQQGFEQRDSYQVQGVINISLPVLDTHGEAIAALTVPFLPRLDSDMTSQVVATELHRAANLLSAAMGCPLGKLRDLPDKRKKPASFDRGQAKSVLHSPLPEAEPLLKTQRHKNHISRRILGMLSLLLALPGMLSAQKVSARVSSSSQRRAHGPWLFAGFKGNSEDGVFYALSVDGYHWMSANGGRPVVWPTELGELMRDPFLQRAPDGSIVMVWTWSWAKPAVLGFSKSTDLIHWSRHRELPVLAPEPNAVNAWAPALYFEPNKQHWLIIWSSTIPGRFTGDTTGDGSLNHRIFSTTTRDFIKFSHPVVFFNPGFSVIDATLLKTDLTTTIIFKDERKTPLKKHLLTATGPSLEGPWSDISSPISETWAEGAAIIPVQEGYLALYDHYREPQHYAALFSRDLKVWTDATTRLSFPPGLRHGSFLPITRAEFSRLNAHQRKFAKP